jgi:hypothetical protein
MFYIIQKHIFEAVQAFGTATKVKLSKSADSKTRDRSDSYIEKEGQLVGISKLVTGWHAVGHPVCSSFFLFYTYRLI